jgi:hypothetical protein
MYVPDLHLSRPNRSSWADSVISSMLLYVLVLTCFIALLFPIVSASSRRFDIVQLYLTLMTLTGGEWMLEQ